MTTTTKAPRTCTNCARVRVVGKTTLHYECSIADEPVNPWHTCKRWEQRKEQRA
jgi:hypothetical protein